MPYIKPQVQKDVYFANCLAERFPMMPSTRFISVFWVKA
uniref:Uncharacterized protein n=1 Tax=Rhizophora mucronata TaxID=61149 RepID=A0A2P2NSQ6_RHIMU